MNLDDKSLFLDAMEDVQPLKRATDVHWHPTRNQRAPQRIDTLQLDNFLTTGFLDIIPLSQPLEFRREGLQHGVLDKLRSGKYPQQASLNLLRQPVEECSERGAYAQRAVAPRAGSVAPQEGDIRPPFFGVWEGGGFAPAPL